MYLPEDVLTKASDVLGTRTGALAMASLVNGRLDVSAVIINPGVEDLPSEEMANRDILLGEAATDAIDAIVDFVTEAEGKDEVSLFSYIDADGAAVCLLADPEDGELQTEILHKMRE